MGNDKELTATTSAADNAVRASSDSGNGRESRDTRALLPRVDVLEDTAGITLLADLPGVSKERLELKVEGDTLLIEGEVGTPMPAQMQSVYAGCLLAVGFFTPAEWALVQRALRRRSAPR
jgi:HSP20 family molecular chaperone IbpA